VSELKHIFFQISTNGCSGLVVEYRTCNREVAGSTHTRSTTSNLEQVANLLCAQINSASYPQRDGKWIVVQLLWATGWRPSVADWGDGVSASCTVGPYFCWTRSSAVAERPRDALFKQINNLFEQNSNLFQQINSLFKQFANLLKQILTCSNIMPPLLGARAPAPVDTLWFPKRPQKQDWPVYAQSVCLVVWQWSCNSLIMILCLCCSFVVSISITSSE